MKKDNLMKVGDFLKVDSTNEIYKISNIEKSFHGMYIISLRDKHNQRFITQVYYLNWDDLFNLKQFTKVNNY